MTRIFVFLLSVFIGVANAAMPGQDLLLFGASSPVAVSLDFTKGNTTQFQSNVTYSGPSLRTITDATGTITSAPNNLLLNSATFSTQGVTVAPSWNYLLACAGSGSITLSGSATGTLTCGGASLASTKISAPTAGTLTLTVSGTVTNAALSAVTYETTYRTGDQVATTAAAYYGPAFDYAPAWVLGASPQLRIEGAQTNLMMGSTTSGVTWGTSGTPTTPTITTNNTVAPDGTTTATKIVFPAISGVNTYTLFYTTYTATANSYADSVYIKGNAGGERLWIIATPDGVTYYRTPIVLTTSWQRFSVVSTKTAATWYFQIGVDLRDTSETSKAAQTVYVWGGQGEQGSFATSYIPSAASATARAADSVTSTGALSTALAAAPWAYTWTAESTLTTSCITGAAGAFTWPSFGWMKSLKVYKTGTPSAKVTC